MTGTIAIVTVLVLVAVIGFGLLIFRLQRKAQDGVPRVADDASARRDRVVAVETDGSAVTEAQDLADRPPRDQAGFEKVLSEELDTLHPHGQGDAARGDS